MNDFQFEAAPVKPLAFTAKSDNALASPSITQSTSQFSLPPLPGSKSFDEDLEQSFQALQASNSLTTPETGLSVSSVPTTPTSPSPHSLSIDTRSRKTNPLNDLIDTEKSYVEQLTGIIRKVAAAWSRSNLPPPELDTMFRCIESVYKSNRSLLSKLKEIGKNPSSPKALGDLLMRWIDDLEAPYTNYSTKYQCGFDTWDPVQSNIKLPGILQAFSAASPPPTSEPSIWTLDSLFLLPKGRLKYYRKLYSRLLRSTIPGKSDHRLLVGATEKLDKLLQILEDRNEMEVGRPQRSNTMSTIQATPVIEEQELTEEGQSSKAPPVESPEPEPVPAPAFTPPFAPAPPPVAEPEPIEETKQPEPNHRSSDFQSSSAGSSVRDSSVSGGERLSRETANTSISRGSEATMSMPITDLEKRLSTQRTLDIFTMTPKAVRLQMSPPQLTYTRELRCSLDAVVSLVPRATGIEVVHQKGHIFLLSDLFLLCERISLEERRNDGPDMWLLFPPLAGKVLRIVDETENVLHVAIMRKEILVLRFESSQAKNVMKKELADCIEFASSVGPMSKQMPPPVPSLNGFNASKASSPITSPRTSDLSSPPTSVASSMYGLPSPDSRFATPSPAPSASSFSNNSAYTQAGQAIPGQNLPTGGNLRPQLQSFQQHQAMHSGRLMSPPPGAAMPTQPGHIMQPHPTSAEMSRTPSLQGYGVQHANSFTPGQVARSASAGSHLSGQGPSPHRGPPPPGSFQGIPEEHAMRREPPQRQMTAPPEMPESQYAPQAFPPQGQRPMPPQQPPYMRQHSASPTGHRMRAPSNPGAGPMYPSATPPASAYGLRKSPSTPSMRSQYETPPPPVPNHPSAGYNGMARRPSATAMASTSMQPLLPSAHFQSRGLPSSGSFADPSPPGSPVEETSSLPTGPLTSHIAAQMKCKVFLKQQHQQWKALGSAKLMLYRQDPTNVKQLVVEADDKRKTVLISTIVLTDGVERVGKTGVAIELSDQGARTGIVYMIQLRNEKSTGGLFDELLKGSDRAVNGR